jgi:hypothetical protein
VQRTDISQRRALVFDKSFVVEKLEPFEFFEESWTQERVTAKVFFPEKKQPALLWEVNGHGLPTIQTSHPRLGAAHQSNVTCAPQTIYIAWAIEAKKIRRGKCPPLAGFDERPGACVSTHYFFSFL